MPKDRHAKVKINARVSPRALQALQQYAEKLEFQSLGEALDFVLLDNIAMSGDSLDEEKQFIKDVKALQRQNSIPNLLDALKRFYEQDCKLT
jgi:hypothetical protein